MLQIADRSLQTFSSNECHIIVILEFEHICLGVYNHYQENGYTKCRSLLGWVQVSCPAKYVMSMKQSSSQLFLEGLRFMSVCPFCSSKEAPTDSKIIESRDDAHMVHLTCKRCGQAILVLVRSSGVGIQCVGIVTDLSEDDAKKLLYDRSVNIDDVLDVHEALNNEEFLLDIRERVATTRALDSQ